MKLKKLHILMIVGLIITIIGLITGQYFFLLLILPFGFSFFRKDSKNED
ncbi:hypothetical protein UMM65_11540 [Aureibaculum sp. 2210JD6-5]|nr:hypothetical protein [Aureibaculum sp. 2210JD6-5]MDY7395880.1 hypothetical protein [Aureibaculum sp. 2210JD6-5]